MHPACKLQDVLRYPGYTVPGAVPSVFIYPKGSVCHKDFLKRSQGRIVEYVPEAS